MSATSEKLARAVEKQRELIEQTADYIWKHPEPGYREWNTSAYLEERFERLGYTLVRAGDIPGFYADLDAKTVSLDIILDFDLPDREAVFNHIKGDIEALYPDFTVLMTMDIDV